MVVAGRYCFFFKQKTAYEMRISDWSSDVCSSDLLRHDRGRADPRDAGTKTALPHGAGQYCAAGRQDHPAADARPADDHRKPQTVIPRTENFRQAKEQA